MFSGDRESVHWEQMGLGIYCYNDRSDLHRVRGAIRSTVVHSCLRGSPIFKISRYARMNVN